MVSDENGSEGDANESPVGTPPVPASDLERILSEMSEKQEKQLAEHPELQGQIERLSSIEQMAWLSNFTNMQHQMSMVIIGNIGGESAGVDLSSRGGSAAGGDTED